jgi:butyryl-CoA dehydrogenase
VGYVEDTGVAQHYRDARIAPIYEGTNGIQAMDLVMRKLRLEGGETVADYLAGLRAIIEEVEGTPKLADLGPGLTAGIDALAEATHWLQERIGMEARAVAAGATPYIQMFGTIAGACSLAQLAVAATREGPGEWSEAFLQSRATLARFFVQQLVPPAIGLLSAVTSGSENLFEMDASAL